MEQKQKALQDSTKAGGFTEKATNEAQQSVDKLREEVKLRQEIERLIKAQNERDERDILRLKARQLIPGENKDFLQELIKEIQLDLKLRQDILRLNPRIFEPEPPFTPKGGGELIDEATTLGLSNRVNGEQQRHRARARPEAGRDAKATGAD